MPLIVKIFWGQAIEEDFASSQKELGIKFDHFEKGKDYDLGNFFINL